MAAYAALVSVLHLIEQIQHHPRPPISLDGDQVQSLTQKVTFLQDFLEVYSHVRNEEVDQLQSRMADAAYAAEDVIESHIVDRILDQSTTHGEQTCPVDFYQALQKVTHDMDFIQKDALEIKEKMGSVRDIQQHRTRSIPVAASLTSSSIEKYTMVGLDDTSEDIMDKLTRRRSSRQIISIVGMGGIGKTTLVKNVYENPLIVQHFDIRAWATISQEYNVKEILFELLRNQCSQESFSQMSEEELGEMLHENLYGRRYLIIMDDMWNIEAWDKLKWYFPRDNSESGIVITSRLSNLASHIPGAYSLQMSFLDEDKSWNLLRKTVFGEDGCPPELEKTGKKIAKQCDGLPLSIVVIGGLLAKSEQTRDYWEYIAENLSSVVNLEDNERCLNALFLSYNYLPIHLKPCFLYMGVYDEDKKIYVPFLIKFWAAEGFLKPISGKSLEEVAEEYLKALVDRNLILVDKRKHDGKLKVCKMHDLLRDLCLREAEKDKFLCVTRRQSHNKFPQDINTQRRIAFGQDKLWQGKDDYDLSETCDPFQSTPLARSLMNISPKDLQSCNFRLSRVLIVHDAKVLIADDAGIIPFYSIETPFQLVNLRLLILGGIGPQRIPSSAYLLWNLQAIWYEYSERPSNFDIWKMPLLRHVMFTWLDLDDPGQDGFVLRNLQTLTRIENFKCGEEAVKRIPNIKELGLFYNSDALAASHYCLNNLGRLHKLESLICDFSSKLSCIDLTQNLTFPHSLKKLTLEGCHLPWTEISTKIGSLPYLQVLKLGRDSFIGPEWETVEGQFLNLKFLKLCGEQLECWITEASHFPRLEHLFLDDLGSLEEIPSDIGNIPTLKLIEIEWGDRAVLVSAKYIAEEQNDLGNQDFQVRVHGMFALPFEEIERMASHNFLFYLK